MLKEKKYITEKIGQQYKEWKDEGIILSSGTDTGKTTFICSVLIPYALEKGENVLYLVNRKSLYDQIKDRIQVYSNTTIMTYQAVQSALRKNIEIKHYNYIIADECHYFLTDGIFNQYTDVAYDWLRNQHDNVVIYMSATAKSFFSDLTLGGIVMPNRIYTIQNNHEEIEEIYFYNKNQITKVIDNILMQHPDDKILVFVNSIKRLKEMHSIYGNKASYLCSKFHGSDKSLSFVDFNCIKECKYESRMLFATKAMDNGIDLKDRSIKHIFSEIIDIDSAIQAIGRKRPIDAEDKYNMYFLRYGNRAIRQFTKIEESDLLPVMELMHDKQTFIEKYKNDRELIRRNKILYGELSEGDTLGTIHINHIVRQKFERDVAIYNAMIADGYENVLMKFLGESYRGKTKELKIANAENDKFLEYLNSIKGEKLFKPEQQILKEKFKVILRLYDNRMGINTLNGKLKDCKYPYKIISKEETKGENRKKRYWMIIENE